jgi:hypothetical protein
MDNNTISVYYGAANRTEGTLIVRNKTAVHINPGYRDIYDTVNGIFYETKGLAVIDVSSFIFYNI